MRGFYDAVIPDFFESVIPNLLAFVIPGLTRDPFVHNHGCRIKSGMTSEF